MQIKMYFDLSQFKPTLNDEGILALTAEEVVPDMTYLQRQLRESQLSDGQIDMILGDMVQALNTQILAGLLTKARC